MGMLFRLAFLFCLLYFTHTAVSHYEILIPRMARPGNSYKVSVSTFEDKVQIFKCEIGIRSSKGDYLVKKAFRLYSDYTYQLYLNVPTEVNDGSYEFYFKSTSVLAIDVSKIITINKKVHSQFIQTDKGLYKPGQKVLFRVVAIKPDLKAYKDAITITIYDTAQNKIKELKNQSSENGVITSELQLSDITPLGKWKIKAESKFAATEQFFTVSEYVLPKYEVIVDLPTFFHYNLHNPALQEHFIATILAKYTYGKPVNGIAIVLIKLNFNHWWYKEPQPTIKKSIKLQNGKADISLTVDELKTLLPSGWDDNNLRYQTIFVGADVTETVTGNILHGENTVPVKEFIHAISFVPSTADNYKPGLEYEAYLQVKRSDGSAPQECELVSTSFSAFKSISVTLTFNYPYDSTNPRKPKKETFVTSLDKRGIAFISFKTDPEAANINIVASFLDQVSNFTVTAHRYLTKFETRDKGGIKLVLLNEEKIIRPNVKLSFEVSTLNPTKRYIFQIISKGNIVYTRYHKSTNAASTFYRTVYIYQSLATTLAPEARFVVSYVTSDGELIADSLALNVIDYMANKITLSFNKNVTKPGDESVVLTVNAAKDSFVGLLGVDQSVLLLNKGNDLTTNLVANELATYNNIYYNPLVPVAMGIRCFDCDFWPIWLGGTNTDTVISNAGLFVLTDLFVQKTMFFPMPMMMEGAPMAFERADSVSESDSGSTSPSTSTTVRKDFPETFIWTETVTNGYGCSELKLKVPDTLTSWIATGFSVSSDSGLGVTTDPAKLTVIKPFFVSLNLPYSIIRGEEFALQANVFNYLGRDVEAEVKLLASKYFKVISCSDKNLTSTDVTKEIEVKNNDATAVYFWVVATSLGHIPIEVRALAGVAADAIKATLLVKPEGQTQSYSTSEFIQLAKDESSDSSFDIELPPSSILVSGSVIIEVTLIGDIMGSSLNGIEDLLKMPYGCGEQNLLGLAPDVYILTYLKNSQRLTLTIESKGVTFITSGYQRQLTYQRTDGSFSAFGQSDKAGSTWLSAFTIKCLNQAKDFIPVEDSKISRTLSWIIRNQDTNGTFSEPPGGRVIHTNMQGGASSGIAMTAYVLISLLENKDNSKVDQTIFQASIMKATGFLESSYEKYSSDPYALAIISYALFKAESAELQTVLDLLDNLAVTEGGLKHWKSKVETPSNTWKSHYGHPSSYDVELASYVLLVYAQKDDISNSLPIAKWLLTKRNAYGGFSSTQDTVLALEALASFAGLIAAPSSGVGITVTVTSDFDGTSHTFDPITQSNALFLQSVQLPEETKNVSISAQGQGVALVQLIVKYNVDSGDLNKLLQLKLSSKTSGKNLTLKITTSWQGKELSGMVLVEVNILTGYAVLSEEMIKKQIGENFKKFDKTNSKLVIYLDELTADELSFDVHLEEQLNVGKVKPALVKVYRYYDPEYVASGFYSSSNDQTWDTACPLCC